jgi:hypothetical protein
MTSAITGGLRLTALRGSEVINHKGVEGIFIPFRVNGLRKHITKTDKTEGYLNIFMIPHKDRFGNDWFVTRARTKTEGDQNVNTEILGNLKYLTSSSNSGGYDPDARPPKGKPNADRVVNDDPF